MKLLFFLATTIAAYAYIPEYSMITSHMADAHGRGGYLIEQNVTYKKEGEAFSIKETWWVLSENTLRVTLEGLGSLKGQVQGTMIFDASQKAFRDPTTAKVHHQRLGDEWLEPLFYFRNSKYFRNRMAALKVAPPESLRERAPLNSEEGPPPYEPPGFIRLSRVGGGVAWAIGLPPGVGISPTVWVEQDQFVVRKFHNSQLLLKADDYNKYDEGLWFPRLRTYSFGPYSVEINTLGVRTLGKLRPDDARFRNASLNGPRDGLKLPEVDGLKEFYSRFR